MQHVLKSKLVDLILPVRDVDHRHVRLVGEQGERVQQSLLVVPREPVGGLIEKEEARRLDHGAAEQHELLLPMRQVEEVLLRRLGRTRVVPWEGVLRRRRRWRHKVVQVEPVDPLARPLRLGNGDVVVQAHRVEEAGAYHLPGAHGVGLAEGSAHGRVRIVDVCGRGATQLLVSSSGARGRGGLWRIHAM